MLWKTFNWAHQAAVVLEGKIEALNDQLASTNSQNLKFKIPVVIAICQRWKWKAHSTL